MDNEIIIQKPPLKTNHATKMGIRIVKIAAFSFAIVSWIATAAGLSEFIFKDQFWQALVISFAVQSVLFVFNLKLPFYFKKIKYKKLKKGESNFLWRGLKNTIFNTRALIALFYAVLLFSSSWFSYVYISNTIYKSTTYIDANIDLDSNYRTFLHQTDEYSNEYKKYLEQVISEELSVLQSKMKNTTVTEPTTDSKNNSLSNLTYDLDIAKMEQQQYTEELKNAKIKQETAKIKYDESLEERWRTQTARDAEKRAFDQATAEVSSKQTKLNEANKKVIDLQKNVNDYSSSESFLIHSFLVEIAKDNPDVEVLNKKVIELYEQVINSSENDGLSANFTDIINGTQALRNSVNDYSTLRTVQSREIDEYLKALVNDNLEIPNPDSKELETEVLKWEEYWETKFRNLEKSIKALPTFSADESDISISNNSINISRLKEYNAQEIIDKMDIQQRNYLAGINQLERAKNLLFSRFNFLAIFSFVFAVFLDVASLLAGLFIFLVNKSNNSKS